MTLVLDGNAIRSEQAFHDAIVQSSGIDFYGRNLDALWDLLIGLVEPPIDIKWTNAALSRAAIGPRYDKLVAVLREAEAELGPARFNLSVEL